MLAHLRQLDELDNKLRAVEEQRPRSRVADFEQRRDRLAARRDELQQQLAQLSEQIAADELRLGQLDRQLRQHQDKLYGGTVTTAQELQVLEKEMALTRDQRSALEDAILSAMEARETREAQLAPLGADLEEAAADALEAVEDEKERQLHLAQRQLDLERARQSVTAHLGPEVLERYRRLGPGQALSKVKGGICLGCHMNVPDSHWRGVKQGQLLNCPTCSRFLYTD